MKALARLAIVLNVLAVLVMTIPRPADAGCTGQCVGGSNGGAICANDSECPGSICGDTGAITNVNACAPGGKGSKDCFIEWSVSPQPPPDKNGFPSAKYECLDNDPACDADTTPGQCTFLVGACVNVTDGRFACTTPGAASYVLKKPSDKDGAKPHKDRFARDNRRNVDLNLSGLGLPNATGNLCTPQRAFVVPLKKGTDKGKGKIGVKLTDTTPETDSDTVQFTCLPNFAAIATIPCASARKITDASELIGGPLAMGRVGDWLVENDKVRFIIRDAGRDFSFMLTYGGHVMDADLQRKLGPTSLSPPYPAGRDSFLGITPLINISSTDNPDPLDPNAIVVMNSGASGGPAILRTTGPDDLFDPIDPAVAIKLFQASLSIPPLAIDKNIPVQVSNDYTLNCGDQFLEMETTITNDGGSELKLYIGDYMAGGGQLELIGPRDGFGMPALRLGTSGGPLTLNYLGWFGFGESQGVSYAIIPELYKDTSAFTDSAVAVPIYGQNLAGILLGSDTGHCQVSPPTVPCIQNSDCQPPATATNIGPCVGAKPPGILNVSASGGTASFKRWFAVSDNGMGRVLDARHTLIARGDLVDAGVPKTGFVQGTVKVNSVPTDGARVVFNHAEGGTAPLIDVFETRDGGFFQGTLPAGDYVAEVKIPGYPYEGGGTTPLAKPITVGSSTSVVDFDVPMTGFVQVQVTDVTGGGSVSLAAKVSVVGVDLALDPGTSVVTPLGTVRGRIFDFDARQKQVIHGLPQVHFAGPSGDTGAFPIPPGQYQFVVSHGPEYSVFKTALITVAAGSETSPLVIAATLVHVVDTTGFVSSDAHVHMLASPDAFVTKEERIVTMLAEGVDYLVASDHDFLTDLTDDVTALGASHLIKTAVSDEITYFTEGHFGAYPLDYPAIPGSVSGGAIDWGRAGVAAGLGYPSDGSYNLSPEEMVTAVKLPPYNAIVVQSNHFYGHFGNLGIDSTVAPPQSTTPPARVRQNPALANLYSDKITALELWIENSRSQNAQALGENLGDWFNMLNNFDDTQPNLRKTATFDSDTHTTAIVQAGGPRNMTASSTDDPADINPVKEAQNLNEGRNVGTNGPFMRVTISGSEVPDAGHALGLPRIVKATGGTATVNVGIQSPTWAEFDRVEIYVSEEPSCTSPTCVGGSNPGAACSVGSQCPGGTCGGHVLGGSKKVCTATPSYTLNKGVDFSVTSVAVDSEARLEANVSKVISGITEDSWVVVIVKGTDNVSKPLFPMAPANILEKACNNDPCKACTNNAVCGFGTCNVNNQTPTDLTDGNLNQCGTMALGIANPLFIDFDGDGLYKDVALPGTGVL